VNYFSDHSHYTKFNGTVSNSASINASVIQGSALGPVAVADLRPSNSGSFVDHATFNQSANFYNPDPAETWITSPLFVTLKRQ